MNIKYLVAFSAAVLSGSLHAVAPGPVTNLQPLALDASGHPRVQWTRVSGAAQYIIERRSDANATGDTACLSTLETLVGGWCRFSIPAGSGSGTLVYTDNNVRIDPASPIEYQYRVAAADAQNNSSAFVSRWANSCPIAVTDPEQVYLDSVRNYNGQAILTAGNIASTTAVTVTPVPALNPLYYVVSNDRYIALFGKKGALVSLAHRNYGKDYVTGFKIVDHDPYKGEWAETWALKLANNSAPNATVSTVSSSSASDPTFAAVADGIRFTWANAGGSGYDIVTTWTLQSLGSSGLHASVSAVPDNPSTGMQELRFPAITGLGYERVDLLWPQDIGRKFEGFPYKSGNVPLDTSRAKNGTLFAGMSMQFMGLSFPIDAGNGNLLYIATEDPDLLPKGLRVQPNALSDPGDSNSPVQAAGFFATYFPVNGTGLPTSKIDSSTHHYDFVMQPMCGDVAKIAKRYRKFAEQQSWTHIGEDKTSVSGDPYTLVPAKTAARIDVPQKLKDGVFWWTQNNANNMTLEFMKDYANDTLRYPAVGLKEVIGPAQGVDVGIHLYNWHTPGFDSNPPEFVERSGGPVDFAGYMAAVQADGTLVLPYINVTNVDVNDRTNPSYQCNSNTGTVSPTNSYVLLFSQKTCGWWNQSYTIGGVAYNTQDQLIYSSAGASKSAALVADTYNGLIVGTARLNSAFWTSVTGTNVATVFDSGAAGVYLDTFGGGYRPNYGALWGVSTGKLLGHDPDWRGDMNALAEIARTIGDQRDTLASTPNKRFVAAEHFGEAFIRDVDLFTVYSDHPVSSFPLAQLVYSDYQLFAGPQGRTADTDAARRLRYGRAFTWGMQPGLTGLDQLCGSDYVCQQAELDGVVAYMRTLTKARKSMSDFLGLGEFLGTPVASSATLVSTDWCVTQTCNAVDSAELPAIQVGRWLSRNGERAFIATNASLSSGTTTVAIPPNWLGATATCFDETHATASCATVTGGSLVIALEPLTVRYISFGTENPDIDGDGIANAVDNCPAVANPSQTDINTNHIGDACENGLTASYFNDADTNSDGHINSSDDQLVAPAALTRIDSNIDFNWGFSSPGAGVYADFFSVRWTGRLAVPVTGVYTFCILGDDGVRLSVNNTQVLDFWVPQDSVKNCDDVALIGGQSVPVAVEFFDATEEGIVQWTWSYPGQAEQVVPNSRLYAQ